MHAHGAYSLVGVVRTESNLIPSSTLQRRERSQPRGQGSLTTPVAIPRGRPCARCPSQFRGFSCLYCGKPANSKKRSQRFRDLPADRWAELFFALALTLATIANVWVANRQWSAANGQLAVMRDQSRAWIKADLIFDGDFQYTKGIGALFPFHLQLFNVGHSPAYNVRTTAFLYTPATLTEDIFATWKSRCEGWKKESDVSKSSGFVMLPGEETPSNKDTMGIPTLGNELIDSAIASPESKGRIRIWIMGCVDYFIDESGTHHQTGILYSLHTFNKDGSLNVGLNPYENLSTKAIHPIPAYFSSGMTY